MENVPLYVDLLNVYLYHYGKENECIDVKWVNALISLIKACDVQFHCANAAARVYVCLTHVCVQDNIDKLPGDSPAIEHYQRTVAFIQKKAMEDERYSTIALNE